ncbi:MAG: hypothetical protein ACRYGO_15755 [Janthinobacterium lividum]
MLNKTVLAVLAGALLSTQAMADEPAANWINVAETSKFIWEAKSGSGGVADMDGKKNIAYSYVYQNGDKEKKTYEYGQIFVKLDACRKGYGYIYYNDMQGKYTGKDAFVRFNNTVADALGSVACDAWDKDTKQVSREDKSDTWVVAAESEKTNRKYSLKTDTVRKRNYNGKPAIAALSSNYDPSTERTTYSEYVFPTAECKRGYGTIYQLDFDGAVTEKYDVVLSGSSVIANVANALCQKM